MEPSQKLEPGNYQTEIAMLVAERNALAEENRRLQRIVERVNILRAVGITPKYPDNSFPLSTAWCPVCLCGESSPSPNYMLKAFKCGTAHRMGDPSRQWVKLCGDPPAAIQFGVIPKNGGPRRFIQVYVPFIIPLNAGMTLQCQAVNCLRAVTRTIDVNDVDGAEMNTYFPGSIFCSYHGGS